MAKRTPYLTELERIAKGLAAGKPAKRYPLLIGAFDYFAAAGDVPRAEAVARLIYDGVHPLPPQPVHAVVHGGRGPLRRSARRVRRARDLRRKVHWTSEVRRTLRGATKRRGPRSWRDARLRNYRKSKTRHSPFQARRGQHSGRGRGFWRRSGRHTCQRAPPDERRELCKRRRHRAAEATSLMKSKKQPSGYTIPCGRLRALLGTRALADRHEPRPKVLHSRAPTFTISLAPKVQQLGIGCNSGNCARSEFLVFQADLPAMFRKPCRGSLGQPGTEPISGGCDHNCGSKRFTGLVGFEGLRLGGSHQRSPKCARTIVLKVEKPVGRRVIFKMSNAPGTHCSLTLPSRLHGTTCFEYNIFWLLGGRDQKLVHVGRIVEAIPRPETEIRFDKRREIGGAYDLLSYPPTSQSVFPRKHLLRDSDWLAPYDMPTA